MKTSKKLFFVFSLLVLLIPIPCFATKTYKVDIKMLPMSIQDERFYVDQVIDGRFDKRYIGTAHVGLFNNRVPAVLSDDLSSTILSLLNMTFTADETKTPIIIVIEELRVSERESITGEYGKAEAKIRFYKKSGEKIGKLFEVMEFIEKVSHWDVSKFHEENIRKVIEKCLISFIESDWENADVQWEDLIEWNESV